MAWTLPPCFAASELYKCAIMLRPTSLPKGTPPSIVNRLNAEITKVTSQPDVKAEWAKQGAVAMTMTPEAFGKYMSDDVVKWERIVKISGAQPDR